MTNRPAETATAGLGAGAAIAAAFASDWQTFATAIVLGILPGAVTFWVVNGGLGGICDLFLKGKRGKR
jgi:ABC-type glycerol-3-phosphate transport system permease component